MSFWAFCNDSPFVVVLTVWAITWMFVEIFGGKK